MFLRAAIAGAAISSLWVASASPAPPPRASYVSGSGDDANACTRAAPCATLQRAYSLASAGQTVFVASGLYPEQTLTSDNSRLAPTHRVVFRGLGRVVIAKVDLEGANNIIFEHMTFGTGTAENHAWYQVYSSNTLCDRCALRGQLTIDGGDRDGPDGTHDAAFTNGSIGGYVANDADPQIGGLRGPDYLNQAQPTNISFINEVFHDIDANSRTPHTECLQILAVHTLLIKNSKFYGCNVHGNGSKDSIMFSGYQAHGTNDDYWNVTLVNDMFTGGSSGSNRIALSWDNQFGFQRDCRNIVVRNSTILGTVLWGCPDETQTLVERTIETLQLSGPWAMRQCNAVFRNDLWTSVPHCPGKTVRYGHPLAFVDASNTARMDLHLTARSYGRALGIGVNG